MMSETGQIGMATNPSANIDPVLVPLSAGAGDDQAEGLSQIIALYAEPVIKRIVRHRLHLLSYRAAEEADADDVLQEAILQLVAKLQKFCKQPDAHPISDVRGLAAVIAHRACALWMRRQFPERHGLKNRIYYLLKRQNGFGLWLNEKKKLIAGFVAWQGEREVANEEQLKQLSDDESLAAQIRWLAMGRLQSGGRKVSEINRVPEVEPGAVLATLFNRLGRPVEFDQLVSALSVLLPTARQSGEPTGENEDPMDSAASTIPDPAWQVEKRIFLQRLWEEIRQLPLPQRAALLLNLRDAEGAGCIALFPVTGVASFRQLAETLGMSPESFAELWNELPLEDTRIAGLLQTTRQKVINARKSARERLARQLKGFI
jgi:DNA-directed RNA polymerase specialized sigma24 family protein